MNIRVFDQEHYQRLNSAREVVLASALGAWTPRFGLSTAADVGCGLGYFSNFLAGRGFKTTGLDGREENVAECCRRWPAAHFHRVNIEDSGVSEGGQFDFVLCFGLLYHLENPFAAIRNLHALTGHLLVVESMCIPHANAVFELRDENCGEDQGLNYVALYPSESALIKLLYQSGFSFVYRFDPMPDQSDFHETRDSHQARTMLAASRVQLTDTFLQAAPEPRNSPDPWHDKGLRLENRVHRFLEKPWDEKLAAVKRKIS